MNQRHYYFGWLCLAAVSALLSVSCSRKPAAFSLGADVSFIPQNESLGAVYYDADGKEKDVCQIMADHHFDNIRLRIFVNPEARKGYSPNQGFCNLEHTIRMAKRIRAAGMNFALDFHYSDTWADPDKQYKPSAWEGLAGQALEDKLYEYTKDALQALDEAGVAPAIVQIGNEINHGFVWPEGFIDDNAKEENWAAMAGLYKAGQRAARETLPHCRIMVHLALGGENRLCRQFLDYLLKYNAEFDLIGLSYYEQWHETYNDLKANLYDLSARYGKPVCVCEYGAKSDNIKKINDIVHSVPGGLGFGTMAWEPLQTLFSFADDSMRTAFRRRQPGEAPVKLIANKEILSLYDELYAQYSRSNGDVSPENGPLPERTFKREEAIIGADVSWLPQQEDKGLAFSDEGIQKDALEILKENKFNWIRLRLFVDPAAEGGYSAEGYCGLEQTLLMAKRIKAQGMKFLLDFHYSDTWADPGKQYTPASWAAYSGSGLEGQVYRYTFDTVRKFIEEGCAPDMVQTGNEINHGMLWPQGKIGESYMPFGVLLRCASAAVRAADESIPVMVHIACGGQNDESVAFLDKIISRDVKFDIIGQSYYPRWHGTLDDLKANLNDLAERYGKPLIVVEYQDHALEVNEIVKDIPGRLGWGTFIWEATSPRWGSLFDEKGQTTGKMNIYPKLYETL
ncbi:MAG: arabinogalactan endo-1,4-beta-galactosidase [Tannerellaceae bacterium]|jgi:arabinogalactan endo-1,4-beta-galactosidase|nr:arabinogalactan endo-1,4-beta-galactosidase [Tannerellaceae bacterium]